MTKQSRGDWTSASNAEADLLCPGRFLAQRGLPEEKSPASEFGTELHEAVATGDQSKLDVEQKDLHESCLAIIDRVGAQYFGNDWPAAKEHPFIERRYWAKFKAGEKEYHHSGQCDRVYRFASKGLVIEIKSLVGDIPGSPENQQLRDQAVLVRGNFMVTQVATAVVQPLVTHSPRVCVYEPDDLRRAEREMFERIVKSHDPNSPRIPGGLQCKFCRARTQCPEYQQWAGSKLPVPASILDTPARNWTPDQWAIFLQNRPTAQKWLDDTYELGKSLLEANALQIPGFKLKPGYDRETIKKPQTLFERFEAIGGKLELYMDCLTVVKTRFENAVHLVTSKKGKALKAQVKVLTEGLTETKKTAPSIERDGE